MLSGARTGVADAPEMCAELIHPRFAKEPVDAEDITRNGDLVRRMTAPNLVGQVSEQHGKCVQIFIYLVQKESGKTEFYPGLLVGVQ